MGSITSQTLPGWIAASICGLVRLLAFRHTICITAWQLFACNVTQCDKPGGTININSKVAPHSASRMFIQSKMNDIYFLCLYLLDRWLVVMCITWCWQCGLVTHFSYRKNDGGVGLMGKIMAAEFLPLWASKDPELLEEGWFHRLVERQTACLSWHSNTGHGGVSTAAWKRKLVNERL